MSVLFIVLIIFFILIAILGIIFYIKASDIFRTLFDNKTISEVARERSYIEENVPKSISGATSLYLPRIGIDFPTFNWPEMQSAAGQAIIGMLQAITKEDLSLMHKSSSPELINQVRQTIEDNRMGGICKYYDDITIHRTEIFQYQKSNGLVIIRLISSLGLKEWHVNADGKIIYGSDTRMKQTKASSTMLYVQDVDKINDYNNSSIGLKCPNCGAPIKHLGYKFCEYCGTGIIDINRNVWYFGKIELE